MKQRDIVLVPFPFSDQSGHKVRPALIISNNAFNSKKEDIIICAITSNLKISEYSINIEQKDIEEGILYDKSSIKVETILKIKKELVIKAIATIKESSFKKVINIILNLFE